jgi:hypothetical protein
LLFVLAKFNCRCSYLAALLLSPFDRSKQKGVKLLADQHLRGKKILISRH